MYNIWLFTLFLFKIKFLWLIINENIKKNDKNYNFWKSKYFFNYKKKMSSDGIKIVLIGESAVGKTCIIKRFTSGTFEIESISSLSAQISSKEIEINSQIYNIDIWDTAGQEKYRSLVKIFYKNSKAIIFVYDITNYKSFEELKKYWIPQTKQLLNENIVYGLVGNKSDLYEKEEVNENEARNFANQINAIFFLNSALNNSGINDLFKNVVHKIIDPSFDYLKDRNLIEDRNNKNIKLGKNNINNTNSKKNNCCKKK